MVSQTAITKKAFTLAQYMERIGEPHGIFALRNWREKPHAAIARQAAAAYITREMVEATTNDHWLEFGPMCPSINSFAAGGNASGKVNVYDGEEDNDDNWGTGQAASDDGDTVTKGGDQSEIICRRCNEAGHMARECPQERDESAIQCRQCNEMGHVAKNCPTVQCRRCLEVGHRADSCPNLYAWPERITLETMDPTLAWNKLLAVASNFDEPQQIKDAIQTYVKNAPGVDFADIEIGLRGISNTTCYLVAIEVTMPKAETLVNLTGEPDRKYKVVIMRDFEPPRERMRAAWPKTVDENISRLADAGWPQSRHVQYCSRCKELGHISKHCKEEANTDHLPKISCVLCGEDGHRARDCTTPRAVRKALTCRQCGEEGHKKDDCENEPNMDLVTCRNCEETGHYSKDCPKKLCKNCNEPGHISKDCDKPRSYANITCRNCDKVGHVSKQCDQPTDWSRVQCSNCQQMGHTKVRCNGAPVVDRALPGGGVFIGDIPGVYDHQNDDPSTGKLIDDSVSDTGATAADDDW